MKAIICLAGQGKRLRPLTDDCPKGLLMVGRKLIIEYLLDNLSSSGITDVIIAVGYRGDLVEKKIGDTYKNCKITYIYNNDYLRTDNLYSLWLCREFVKDGMIFFNGDIIFNSKILDNIVKDSSPDSLAVDESIELKDDAMKVRVDDGRLVSIGKKIDFTPNGWAIGIYKLSQSGSERFFEISNNFFASGPANVSFVVPFGLLAQEIGIIPVSTSGHRWVEIDDMNDYQQAQAEIAGIV